jgi:excisionase family DNA binding protein
MSSTDDDLQLYTTSQVAELCQVTTETVRNWITKNTLPALQINGLWRVRKSDLRAFLTERHGEMSGT